MYYRQQGILLASSIDYIICISENKWTELQPCQYWFALAVIIRTRIMPVLCILTKIL